MADHVPSYLTTHTIQGDELVYGLNREVQDLARGVEPGQRQGKILAKQPGLSVVLVAMAVGNKLGAHATPGSTTVQVLTGDVTFRAGDDTARLRTGELVSLAPEVLHDAEAHEPSVLLVTVAAAVS